MAWGLRAWGSPVAPCLLVLALAAALLLPALASSPGPALTPPPPDASGSGEVRSERAYGELPLAFEAAAGRAGPGVDFIARSASGTALIGSQGATLAVGAERQTEAVSLKPVGAADPKPRSLERLPGVVNDLRGDDPARWRTEIPTFARVSYPEAWPGIDLEWRGNQRQLEYDLRLAPGADPAEIGLRVAGADRLRLARGGDLVIAAGKETIRHRAPVAYQPGDGAHERTPVRSAFSLRGETVGFRLGPYDRARPLVIDPLVLAYSTYLGGTAFEEPFPDPTLFNADDRAYDIAVDSAGAAYVTGETHSTDFDTVNEIEGEPGDGRADVFVSKLNPAGDALVYSTYLGGSSGDTGHAIAVDSDGAAYVAGYTFSSDFNTTAGAFEGDSGSDDAFVSKLSPAGSSLVYSTYLGGAFSDRIENIALGASGAAYVSGTTLSTDFDTVNQIEEDSDGVEQDVFVSKLAPAGDALVYSTYLGGSGGDQSHGIAVDSTGAAYVTGNTGSTDFDTTAGAFDPGPSDGNVFVSKLVWDETLSQLALGYSTLLGGNSFELGHDVAVDSTGAAYVTGETFSTDFDTVNEIEGDADGAIQDAFVSKLSPAGDALVYSTYLGGNNSDVSHGIAVDSAGAAHVTGLTFSTDFNTVDEIEGAGGVGDVFVSQLSPSGDALVYSTYLGGGSHDVGRAITLDAAGAAYVTGETQSTDFDTVNEIEGDSGDGDAFISKLAVVPCTITGTAGPDLLVGTPAADGICGLEGRDTIFGEGGDDELYGGEGRDHLVGGLGDDTLDGGPGAMDRAGYHADATGPATVDLTTGTVTSANLGADTIVFEGGLSTIERAGGTPFDDLFVGDSQANLFDAEGGDDQMSGGGGADVLRGDGGADELSGEEGADTLDPGSGDDPLVSGGIGSDILRYVNAGSAGVAVDLAAGTASALNGGSAGTDTLTTDIENVVGSAGPDVLEAVLEGIASFAEGGDGADQLTTEDGDGLDVARGGDGADTCTIDAGDRRRRC